MDDDREAKAAAAAQQAEQERIAAEKAAAEAARQAEQERIAAEKKAEQERIAAEKAAADAARQAEQKRIAAEKKAEQERIAAEKQAEQERIAAEKKAEQERIAAEKAAADAARQAEQERIAAEKKAEQERIAAEKQAEQERIAAEKQAKREEQAIKAQHRRDSLNALPWNTFFTANVASSLMPQFSYGFKVGQVKVVGWYFSAMSNFHFKGAFKPFEHAETYVLTGKQSGSRISCTAGLVARPCRPLSIHIGAGFGYRGLTMETSDGWRLYPKRTYYGVDAALGLMFHINWFAISAEVNVNTFDFNHSEVVFRNRMEAKLGFGFMLPNKKK